MRIAVIGAGPAGFFAATEAARRACEVVLLEKNGKTGVKILMSGGTRCNLTQDTDARGIVEAFGHARRFLQPSVGAFGPREVVERFRSLGVPTKVEPTGKVFPQSDRAVDVRDALERMTVNAGVDVRLRCGVKSVHRDDGRWRLESQTGPVDADRVIVTAGGRSWPGCGTTGDAYAWLSGLGHTIVPPRPALVPLVGGRPWMHELSGVTLEDAEATVMPATAAGRRRRPLVSRRAPWLFTHFGYSGPAAMDVSGTLTAADGFSDLSLTLDLLPGLSAEDLDATFSDRRGDGGRRRVATLLVEWLPQRLASALARQASADTTIAELPRASRSALVESLKRLPLPVSGTRGFAKAEVTAGGVRLSEVDPKTMKSRLAAGLFIAGEVLDVDGWIGGYNFQAAFSTGRAAGIAAATLPHGVGARGAGQDL